MAKLSTLTDHFNVNCCEQLCHHTRLHCLLPEDVMQINVDKWILILLPKLIWGESNPPYKEFYSVVQYQSK